MHRRRLHWLTVASSLALTWQPSLFAAGPSLELDRSFRCLRRVDLDETSWIDHAPGWVCGSDVLFEQVIERCQWQQRSRRIYDGHVDEPRLTDAWTADSGDPVQPTILEDIRSVLSTRYGRTFDSIGFNLYRDGRDSVAWHGDHIPHHIHDPIVALVSLGEPRRFLLRPKGGGPSRVFALGRGDLLVTGGTTQRTWQHSVPKVARAGPRVSLGYRHS
jgi:alkylated DNA repair dioxygenase AlkB